MVVRTDIPSKDDNLDPTVAEIKRKVNDINASIESTGVQIMRSDGSTSFQEYNERYQRHLHLMDESFEILRTFYPEKDTTRLNNIMEWVERGAELINKADEFGKFQADWRKFNESMIHASRSLERLGNVLTNKRCKITGQSFHSIYFFLQFEDVESLDSFWEEYKSGKLSGEIEQEMSGVAVIVDERNYKAYRKFLCKYTLNLRILYGEK